MLRWSTVFLFIKKRKFQKTELGFEVKLQKLLCLENILEIVYLFGLENKRK